MTISVEVTFVAFSISLTVAASSERDRDWQSDLYGRGFVGNIERVTIHKFAGSVL